MGLLDQVIGGLMGGGGAQSPMQNVLMGLLSGNQGAQQQNQGYQQGGMGQGMAGGGMYDQFAGGFFRYSTTRDWSIPHYEKMLEDNARLTSVYAQAATILNDSRWLDVVESAHGWLSRSIQLNGQL